MLTHAIFVSFDVSLMEISTKHKTKFDIFAGPLHIVSFIPKNMNKEESNEWTLITKKILLDKHFMISRPFYKDRYFLRVVMGNYNTKESHILELTKLLNLRINE